MAWKVGQRVGVGFFGGEDGTCETRRRGDTAYCQNPIITGVTSDGGYAENDDRRGYARWLSYLKSSNQKKRPRWSAPMASLATTFNALLLQHPDARAIPLLSRVVSAVWGTSACNTPKRWASAPLRSASVQTKNISRPSWERTFTSNAKAEDAGAALQKLGRCRSSSLATAPSGAAIAGLLPGLSVRGTLVVVGVSGDPIPVNGVPLIFGGRSVSSRKAQTGRAIETQDTL